MRQVEQQQVVSTAAIKKKEVERQWTPIKCQGRQDVKLPFEDGKHPCFPNEAAWTKWRNENERKYPGFPDYPEPRTGKLLRNAYAYSPPEWAQLRSRDGKVSVAIFDATEKRWLPELKSGGSRKLRRSKSSESQTRKVKRSHSRRNVTYKSGSSSRNRSRKHRNSMS